MTGHRAAADRIDIYDRITRRILADLEQDERPWVKPWSSGHAAGRITRPLRARGEAYNGINVIILWMTAQECGYTAPTWMTFKQALELGGAVRKGERGTTVVYAGRFVKPGAQPATGEERAQGIPFLKSYSVFNVEQIDGLPADYYPAPAPVTRSDHQRIAAADLFFANTGAELRHCGNEAYYAITDDRITMPPFEAFIDAEAFYATLGHETAHWTRHKLRLGRDFGRKKWGDEGYAMEELVAEISAALLCADLGLSPLADPRQEHAAYIGHWIKILNNDKRAIFTAAAHAQRAVTFLHDLQPAATPLAIAAE